MIKEGCYIMPLGKENPSVVALASCMLAIRSDFSLDSRNEQVLWTMP